MSISATDLRPLVGECPTGLKGSFIDRALDPDNGFGADGDIPMNAVALAIVFKLCDTNQLTAHVDEYCIPKENALRLLMRAVAAIDHTVFDLDTMLTYGLYDAVREKLQTGEAAYDQIGHEQLVQIVSADKDGLLTKKDETPLIYACSNYLSDVALALIATGNSHPEHVNSNGYTALIHACSGRLKDVALALIATGNSRPEHADPDGNTALIWACFYGLSDVALALIATGNSRPEHADSEGNTALIWTCHNGLSSDVALALIATGNSRPEHVNLDGYTALSRASLASRSDVTNALTADRRAGFLDVVNALTADHHHP